MRRSMAKKSGIHSFPEEIVTKILVRVVPVKSLLISKSVCKLWLSIISNPSFIKSYIHRSIIISPPNNPTLLTILNPPPLDEDLALATSMSIFFSDFAATLPAGMHRKQLVNQAVNDTNARDLSRSPVYFDRIVMPRNLFTCQIVGCCNGIICLFDTNDDDVSFLWNPSIRMFKKIPGPVWFGGERVIKSCKRTLGFGYDSLSDDYKLVLSYCDVPYVEVYSTNANSWTSIYMSIELWINWEEYTGTNVVVNGLLYFDGENKLLSFDLHNEVFGLVSFPNSVTRKRSNVMDFKGSVALIFESESGGVDLWTLDDVSSGGGQVSWTKNFSIQDDDDGEEDTTIRLKSYLGARQFFGVKLLHGDTFLYNVLYDYEKREVKYHGLGEQQKVRATIKYNGTLVSLDGFEKTE